MKKIWLAKVMFCLALLLVPAVGASAHFLNYYSVDGYKDIDWAGSTKWGSHRDYAHARWDNAGDVDIHQDTLFSIADLEYADTYRRDVTWVGRWTYYSCKADLLLFNDYYMYRNNWYQRTNTALHEVGHAIGLDHSYLGNVMNSYVTSQTYLGKHDLDDYHSRW